MSESDAHTPPSWMFDADGALMKPDLGLSREMFLTNEQWDRWWNAYDAAVGARSHGKGGVKIIGSNGDPEQRRWAEVIDALIDIERLSESDREALVRAEWVKYPGCPGCGSSGAFLRRDKASSGSMDFERGQVRVTCGRRCRTRDVLGELGIETLPDGSELVSEWDGPVPAQDAAGEAVRTLAGPDPLEVEREAYRLRVRDAAREKVAAEKAALNELPAFDADLLVDVLQRPAEPPERVTGLIPWQASTLIVAMRKTGKTTTELNLARSLLLGEAFLDRFEVRAITGRVAILNYEVGAAQLARWADEVGVPRDRLYLVNLRGRRNPLSHEDDRAALAERLRAQEVETLIVDPFGRAYTGQSQNDSGEVGAWLADLDRFARGEVGASDLILAVHAGWEGERTRGASALEDWADSIITLARDKDDESARFFKATGRDVDVDEDRLSFDPATRHLSLTGQGSRKQASAVRKSAELVPEIVSYVRDFPGCSQASIEENVSGRGKSVRDAITEAVDRGLIEREKQGQKWVHQAPRPTSSHLVPDDPDEAHETSSPRLYRDEDEVEVSGTGLQAQGRDEVGCISCGQIPTDEAGLGVGGQCLGCESGGAA